MQFDMQYKEEYKSKLTTPDEAVKLVKSGDWVDYGSNNSMPISLDSALALRKNELHGVKIRGNLLPGPIQIIECDPEMEHFVYNTWHCGAYERKMCDAGRAFFIPMLFRKGILGLAIGSRELYDWISNNDDVVGYPLNYVNDPAVIASMDNFISINGCLNVDLYGQVCSESSGTRQISGTGGQLDFVTGSSDSNGGKSFLCMSSTYTDRKGVVHSRILPKFENGDIITTPRAQTLYVATEYGVVNLAGRSTWERAEALISIADPKFQDELIAAANAQKIWLPSNKR